MGFFGGPFPKSTPTLTDKVGTDPQRWSCSVLNNLKWLVDKLDPYPFRWKHGAWPLKKLGFVVELNTRMDEILQLTTVVYPAVYPMIYRALTIQGDTSEAPNGFSPQSKRCRPPTVGVCRNQPHWGWKLAPVTRGICSKSAISTISLSRISSLRLEKQCFKIIKKREKDNKLFESVPRLTRSIHLSHSSSAPTTRLVIMPLMFMYVRWLRHQIHTNFWHFVGIVDIVSSQFLTLDGWSRILYLPFFSVQLNRWLPEPPPKWVDRHEPRFRDVVKLRSSPVWDRKEWCGKTNFISHPSISYVISPYITIDIINWC